MKNILGLLILLSTFIFGQESSWKFVSPFPDGENNLAIKAIGEKLFVCGLFGKIATSNNQGVTWEKQEWQTVRNLFEIEFYDENNGIVVGGLNDIFKTTNGGKNWVRKTAPQNVKLKDVEYVSKDIVIAVGEGNCLVRSTDGGDTWSSIKYSNNYFLWGLCYNRQSKIGLASGQSDSGGIIMRTTDEGLSWKEVSGITDTIPFWDVNFSDANTAIAVGGSGEYQVIKKSTDGGLTWKKIETASLGYGIFSALESVKFADKLNGVIVGHSGVILKTTDGGENWTPYWGFNNLDFDDVEFADSKTGYITGQSGIILKTTDAGTSWKDITKGNRNGLRSVTFSTPLNGVITGMQGTVLITKDGGKTWQDKSAPTSFPLLSAKMIDSKHILAYGWQPSGAPKGVLTVTTDGGEHWKNIDIDPLFCPRAIDFFDDKNGLLVGFLFNSEFINNEKGELYRTSDGGMTWKKETELTDNEGRFPPLAMQVLSSTKAIIMGETGSFFKTSDAGKTWSAISFLPYHSTACSMDFLDEMNGFISTMNGIFKTSNGGLTWELLYDAALLNNAIKSIHFCNKNTGYAVGDGSTSPNYTLIMKTTNGGVNWDFEFPPTVNPVAGVFAVTDTVAFIVGAGGTILTNGTQGVPSSAENNFRAINGYSLGQNYPNPFNPATSISYTLTEQGKVTLKVFDVLGKEVAVLVNAEKPAGSYTAYFNAANLSSGIYFYTISTGKFIQTKKMILMK